MCALACLRLDISQPVCGPTYTLSAHRHTHWTCAYGDNVHIWVYVSLHMHMCIHYMNVFLYARIHVFVFVCVCLCVYSFPTLHCGISPLG